MQTVLQAIATTVTDLHNAEKNYLTTLDSDQRHAWAMQCDKYEEKLKIITDCYLPQGSGFNIGTIILVSGSNARQILLFTAYQHLGDNGKYIGWVHFTIKICANLISGYTIDAIPETTSAAIDAATAQQIKTLVTERFADLMAEPFDAPYNQILGNSQ